MKNIEIRQATIDDTECVLNIYQYYVSNTAISFEYTPPSVEEFRERIKKILERYPYLVAVKDNKIVGYAYADSFVGREAYRFSTELTVYINNAHKRQGIGKLLYQTLEDKLKEMGITNLYACIATPVNVEDEYLNFNSVNFHKHLGFNQVGEFHRCGYKFDRWYNMVWMEKFV